MSETTSNPKASNRNVIIVAATFAALCASLALAFAASRQVSKANATVRRNNALAESLIQELAGSRAYEVAVTEIAATDPTDIKKAVPFAVLGGRLVSEGVEVSGKSGLHMRKVTAEWKAIDLDELGDMIATISADKPPYRLAEISITPSMQPPAAEVRATFVTFTK